jgi:hypothetical protein
MNVTATPQQERNICATENFFVSGSSAPGGKRNTRNTLPIGRAERLRSHPRARGVTHRPCRIPLASLRLRCARSHSQPNSTRCALLQNHQPLQGPRMAGLSLRKKTEAALTTPARRISKKIRNAVVLLVSGECRTVKAAAERVKLSRSHLSRSLHEPHIRAFAERELAKTIGTAQLRAASVMANLMDSARSEHVKKDASEFFLGLAGHVVRRDAAPAINIGVNIEPGYYINLEARQPSEEPAPPSDSKPASGRTIEHDPAPTDPKVVPWHTVRPVGRG